MNQGIFMKLVLVIFFGSVNTILLLGQMPNDEVRSRLQPLRSTRKDVEQMARRLENNGPFVRYETAQAFIDVEYSQARCEWHGWDVAPDTVLSFNVYRKGGAMRVSDVIAGAEKEWAPDYLSGGHFTNSTKGVRLVIAGDGTIRYARYVPLKSDSTLRCTGFPPYDIADNDYAPAHKFELERIREWDVGLLGGFLADLKKDTKSKGTIFIYSNQTRDYRILKEKIEIFAHEMVKVPRSSLQVNYGGVRDRTEIEAFLLPVEVPSPAARPKHGLSEK